MQVNDHLWSFEPVSGRPRRSSLLGVESRSGFSVAAQRVDSELLRHVRGFGVDGVLVGDDVKTLINETVVPFLSSQIDAEVEGLDSVELKLVLARRLDHAASNHIDTMRPSRPISAEVFAHSLAGASVGSLLWQVLLEYVQRRPPVGNRRPRELDELRLLALSDRYSAWSNTSDLVHYRLTEPRVEVTHSAIKTDNQQSIVRFEKLARQVAAWRRDAEQEDLDFGPMDALIQDVVIHRRAPSDAGHRIDEAFGETFGHSLTSLLTTLWAVAVAWPSVTLRSAQVVMRRLEREALPFGWEQALKSLVFPGSTSDGSWVPGRLNDAPYRLPSHPILEVEPNRWLISPNWSEKAFYVYVKHLVEGTWANHSDDFTGTAAQQVLRDQERFMNEELEADISRSLAAAGIPCIARVKKPETIGLASTGFPGEIDVLAVDPDQSTVWVIEAKDMKQTHSARHMAFQLGRVWGHNDYPKKSYAKKLAERVDVVSSNSVEVANRVLRLSKYMGPSVPADSRAWVVKGLLVTREPDVAGVYVGRTFPVVWLARLVSFLRSAS